MPTGHVSVEQLTAILSTLPLDLTFVDAEDRVAFFSEGPDCISRVVKQSSDAKFSTATRRVALIRSTRYWTTFAQAAKTLLSSVSIFKTRSSTPAISLFATMKAATWEPWNSLRTWSHYGKFLARED